MNPGKTNSIFPGKFKKIRFFQANLKKFDFFKQIFEKFQFFQANLKKIDFFKEFSKKFDFFQAMFRTISIFQAKIANLQLLDKLIYFSSIVTTFEHTSCT